MHSQFVRQGKAFLMVCLASLVSVALSSCGGAEGGAVAGPAAPNAPGIEEALHVTVTPRSDTIRVGQTRQLSVSVTRGDSKVSRAVTWTTGDSGVVRVNASGLVTAVGVGKAKVRAAVDSWRDSATVVVISPVASVKIAPSALTLPLGQSGQLSANAFDRSGSAVTGYSTNWTSSNPTVVTVSQSGAVTSLAVGAATVTATVAGISATAAVTIAAPAVARVALTPSVSSVTIGQTLALSVSALDAAGATLSGRQFTFSSSAPGVATVSASGVVSGVTLGTSTITASSGGQSATASITVSNVPVASLTLTLNSPNISVGQITQSALVARDSAGKSLSGRAVAYQSSNPALATVSAQGIVAGIAAGQVTITAVCEGKTANASLTVTPLTADSVTLTPTSVTFSVGKTSQLSASPLDAAGKPVAGRQLSFASSNVAVVTVGAGGLITALSPGNATVTVTVDGHSAMSAVTVIPAPASKVVVALQSSTVIEGQTTPATATLTDSAGKPTTGSVSWTSSDTRIAAVSSAGVITAMKAGSATVKASSGSVSGTAAVTVVAVALAPVASVSVSLNASSLSVGEVTQAVAVTKDAQGNVLTGRAIAWSTAQASVSVSQSGLITGITAGGAVVSAASEGQTGSANVTVSAVTQQSPGPDFTSITRGIRPRGFGQGGYTPLAPVAGGRAYYVATSGDDAAPGTSVAPLRTVAKAAQLARAGDVVTIRPGVYTGTVRVANSGMPGAPIVFQAESRGNVVFTDPSATFQPAGWTGLPMHATGQQWVTLYGLVFRDWAGSARGTHGVRAIGHWHIDDCLFERSGYVGLQIEGDSVVVERSTFQYHTALSLGAYAPENPALVQDDVRYPPLYGIAVRDLVLRGNGVAPVPGLDEVSVKFLQTSGATIDNIEAFENNGPGWWFDSQNRNWTIRNSYIHDNHGGSAYGVHVEISWGPGLIEHNVFMNNDGAGVFVNSSQNTTINENLFINNRMCVMLVNELNRGFPMHDITITGNRCKAWREYAAMHTLGGTFTTPASMRVVADGNVYDPSSVSTLAWWYGLNGATSVSQLRSIFGWETNGAIGSIAYP